MKFKKDGKVYNGTEEMLNANCKSIATCLEGYEIRKRCRQRQSCADYAYVHPAEVAQYLGFEVLEDDSSTIAEIIAKHGEDVKPDPVNRPTHYTSGGIECIDAMQAAFGDEAVKDFCLCNTFKYLWRHRQKNGVEDLKKVRWYLNRLITEMEVGE